jgi:hypothetical protein
MCFEHLLAAEFDIQQACHTLAGTDDEQIVENINLKITEYLHNIRSALRDSADTTPSSIFKGLPKKYHTSLEHVIAFVKHGMTN